MNEINVQRNKTLNLNKTNKQVGFFKKKPMKRSAAVCFKRFPFALDFSVVDSPVRDSHTFQFRFLYMNVVSCNEA